MALSKSIDLMAASMSARARAQEIVANNLANVTTDGYLRQRVTFAEELAGEQAKLTVEANVDLTAGPASATGNPADVALRGASFLVVQTPAGDRFTRSGALSINAAGELSNRQGLPVLGEGGPITPGSADFRVTVTGDVVVNGSTVDRLRVVEFPRDAHLMPVGGGLLVSDKPPQPTAMPELLPGHRQGSNVQVVGEMVTMVESARLYELTAKALRSYDEVIGQLIATTKKTVG
jgi:flagellar basal-body rod protein FlgF